MIAEHGLNSFAIKVIDGHSDIRDESKQRKAPGRSSKSNCGLRFRRWCQQLLKHQPSLQINFGVINLCLVEGRGPKILPITFLITNYVDFPDFRFDRVGPNFLLKRGSRSAITFVRRPYHLAHDPHRTKSFTIITGFRRPMDESKRALKLKAFAVSLTIRLTRILAMTPSPP